LKLLRLWK